MGRDMCGDVKGQVNKSMLRIRKTRKVEEMLDAALSGSFRESDYDESELSRVETKWKRFLSTSALSREHLEREKENVKSLVSDISPSDQNAGCQYQALYRAAERTALPGGGYTGKAAGDPDG